MKQVMAFRSDDELEKLVGQQLEPDVRRRLLGKKLKEEITHMPNIANY